MTHEFGTYVNSSTQPDSNIFPSLSIVVDALFPSFVLFLKSLSLPPLTTSDHKSGLS